MRRTEIRHRDLPFKNSSFAQDECNFRQTSFNKKLVKQDKVCLSFLSSDKSNFMAVTNLTTNQRELRVYFFIIQKRKHLRIFFMLSVRISSYGCTQEVWRARKMRKSSSRLTLAFWVLSKLPSASITRYTDAKSISKFFYNRATKRICTKKPFIVIECKILTTHKKVNKLPYWLVKNMPHFIL